MSNVSKHHFQKIKEQFVRHLKIQSQKESKKYRSDSQSFWKTTGNDNILFEICNIEIWDCSRSLFTDLTEFLYDFRQDGFDLESISVYNSNKQKKNLETEDLCETYLTFNESPLFDCTQFFSSCQPICSRSGLSKSFLTIFGFVINVVWV